MTEAEAYKKLCCADFTRDCRASKCMAWRWAEKRNPDWKPEHGMMTGWQPHPDDRSPTHIKDDKHGYCGLAGRL